VDHSRGDDILLSYAGEPGHAQAELPLTSQKLPPFFLPSHACSDQQIHRRLLYRERDLEGAGIVEMAAGSLTMLDLVALDRHFARILARSTFDHLLTSIVTSILTFVPPMPDAASLPLWFE
jgi:hypothetical protein